MNVKPTSPISFNLIVSLLIPMLFAQPLVAQELVTNGGFESFSQLPDNGDQVDRLANWEAVTFTPDYLNTGFEGVLWGAQDQGAFRGTGFLGFFSVLGMDSTNIGWSEGVFQELQNGPIEAGETYDISIATMTAQNYLGACGGIRLFGISYRPIISGRGVADTLRDVVLLWEAPQNDEYFWQEYNGSFTSPAALDYIILAFGWEFNCRSYGFIDEVSIQPAQATIQGLPSDIALCDSSSVLLTLDNPGAQYTWQDGSTDSTFLVTQSGLYTVTIDLDGTILRDSINVDLQQRPILALPSDTVVCGETELRITSPLLADRYRWSTGDTGPETIMRTNGEVSLEISVGACTVRDTFSVAFRQNPSPDLGPDQVFCEGDSLVLSVDFPDAVVRWNDGSFGESLNASQSGTYSVNVLDETCVGNDTIVLTFNENPAIDLGEDLEFCESDTIQLQPLAIEAGTSYLWSTGQSDVSTIEVILPQNTSEQTLTTELVLTGDRQGCSTSDTISLVALRTVTFELGQDTTICSGDSLNLSINATTQNPIDIRWNTGQSDQTIFARAASTYRAEVTSIDGCITADELMLAVEELPVLDFETTYSACEGDTILLGDELTPLPGVIYRWNDGLNTLERNVFADGIYSIVASSANCSTTATTEVLFDNPPNVDLGPDTTLCPDDQLILFLPLDLDEIRWQDGSDATEYVVTTAGTYEVEVKSRSCEVIEGVRVSQPELPNEGELLGDAQTLCRDTEVILDASWLNANFLWSTGESSPRIFPDTPGLYAVTLTVGGCEFSDAVEVLPAAAGACAPCEAFLPTAFSPNGDAVNDELRLFFQEGCALRNYRMQVFDRWGNQLFTSTDQNIFWDGTARGQALESGIFTVVVELQFEDESSPQILRGDVAILR